MNQSLDHSGLIGESHVKPAPRSRGGRLMPAAEITARHNAELSAPTAKKLCRERGASEAAAVLKPNTDLAVEFVDVLHPEGRRDLVAINAELPPKHPDKIEAATFDPEEQEKMRAWIEARQGLKNLYVSVNQGKTDAPRNARLKKSAVGSIKAIITDIDAPKIRHGDPSGENFRRGYDRLLQVVAKRLSADERCPPSLLVDSGGGLQAWWKLEPPLPATPDNIELVEGIGRTIKIRNHGDGVHDVARIMRLPGTINVLSPSKRAQGREPAVATVLVEHSRPKHYTIDELKAWAPPTPEAAKAGDSKSHDAPVDIDMGAVLDAAQGSYEDLPSDLRQRFEAECARRPSLKALWKSGEHPNQKDVSGSGREFNLARFLKASSAFTATEFGQLVVVWDHQRASPDRDLERELKRDWRHNPDGSSGFSPMASAEGNAGTAPASSVAPWEDPTDLWQHDEDPVDLPSGVVPALVESVARDHARRLGVEAGGPAAAIITVLGSLVHAGNSLQMRQHDPDWTVRPVQWLALIADSGANKTATLGYAVKPAKAIDAKLAREYAQAMRRYEELSPTTKRHAKTTPPATSFEAPNPAEINFYRPPEKPRLRQKLIYNATTEAIAEILANNSGGALSYRDELAGFFGGMDAYRQKGGVDRPFWLEAKDGGPYTVNRRTSEPLFVENLAVSVLGGMQPEAMRNISAGLATDGLLQRFLPVFLRRLGIGEDVAPAPEIADALDRLATALMACDETRKFRFNPEADQELRAQQEFVASKRAQPDLHPAFGQWLDKSINEFGRLALIFHFIDWFSAAGSVTGDPPPEFVAVETARLARRYISEFAYPHARVFYRRILGASPVEDHARWAAEYILSRGLSSIRNRDIYKNYPLLKRPEKRGELAHTMRQLQMLDWIRAANDTREGPTLWTVDPSVHQIFRERAAKERTRRTEVRENIRRNAALKAADSATAA
jgi:Protein of unknown function (DUF3987)